MRKKTTLSTPEVSFASLVAVLTNHFSHQLANGSIDIVVENGSDSVEVQSDEWTLSLEGSPVRSAFIALDSVTDTEAQHRAELSSTLNARDMAAISEANRALGNGIARALIESGDGASQILAEMIAANS